MSALRNKFGLFRPGEALAILLPWPGDKLPGRDEKSLGKGVKIGWPGRQKPNVLQALRLNA
ncbi:MAG: hypothetical protein LBU69_02310 [Deltaproteobacteria bacterium]|nr:hypothetical protein [Deltaproteobacteria bacterium]